MKTKSYPMTDREHATVLAALRYYQQQGLADDRGRRPVAIHAIATDGGAAGDRASPDGDGIDALCERLNTRPSTAKDGKRTRLRVQRRETRK